MSEPVVEPTEAMLIAARDWSQHKYGKPIGNDAAIGCWKAMLSAAPQEADKDGELTKIGMLIRPRSGLINFVQQIDALPLEVHETMEVFAALPSDEKGAIKGDTNE